MLRPFLSTRSPGHGNESWYPFTLFLWRISVIYWSRHLSILVFSDISTWLYLQSQPPFGGTLGLTIHLSYDSMCTLTLLLPFSYVQTCTQDELLRLQNAGFTL